MQQPLRALPSAAPPGDAELIARARSGDHVAFDALVDRRLGSAFRLARSIVGETADAEDVVQDAFVSAWQNLPGLRDADRFDAWFRRILVNSARMHVRRRRPSIPLQVYGPGDDPDRAGRPELGEADPAIDAVGAGEALQRAIARLTIDQRTILALHHLDERPVADVAQILGIPVGTAKWRLHAARNALERAMESER